MPVGPRLGKQGGPPSWSKGGPPQEITDGPPNVLVVLLSRGSIQTVHYHITLESHWETSQIGETLASYEDSAETVISLS